MTGQEETDVLATVRGLGVVIERMESQFRAFGERLQAVDEKLDAVDARLTGAIQRLEDKVDVGFARVDRELGLVKAAVLEHDRELREMGRSAH